MKQPLKGRERNYGVDLLKIVSMLMVTTHHVLKHGGILKNNKKYSPNYNTSHFLNLAVFCAVNIFGLTTGYLVINSKCKYIKIIPLWLRVVYYSSILILFFYFFPQYQKVKGLNITNYKLITYIVAPASSKVYWYFTSYFGMYFCIPYLNRLLKDLTQKEYKKLISVIIAIYIILPMINRYKLDPFIFSKGFSQWWLGCLYVIGGYFKLFPVRIPKIISLILYFVCVTISWATLFTDSISLRDYNTPFVFLSAVFLLLFFTNIKVNNKILQKILVFGSSTSFSVYLIHDNPYIRGNYIANRFKSYNKSPPYLLVLKVLGTTISIYMICTMIDLIRRYLFKFLKINDIPMLLEKLFTKKEIVDEDKDETDYLINRNEKVCEQSINHVDENVKLKIDP